MRNILQMNTFFLFNRWVMTAAHCVSRRTPSTLETVIGDHITTDNDGDEQRIRVCSIHTHPKYRRSNYDIALLRLCKPVRRSKFVKTIALPSKDLELKQREKLAVAGWGLTKERGRVSPILRVVKVDNIDMERCTASYEWLENNGNTRICAGIWEYGGKDSCQGDSGGPLWHENRHGNIELVGIVSSGRGCARPYYPGLYTKVSVFMGWVNEIM